VAVGDADHRVVARGLDRPVVGADGVGQSAQTLPCIVVLKADALIGHVSRREHHDGRRRHVRAGHRQEEQVVEGAVGEHEPDQRVAGGDQCRHRGVRAAPAEHDGSCRRPQGLLLGVVHHGDAPGRRQVGHHHSERLGTPALALAEAGHRSVVGGIARQVVATDPLDGDDRSGDQRPLQKRQYGVGASTTSPSRWKASRGPQAGHATGCA